MLLGGVKIVLYLLKNQRLLIKSNHTSNIFRIHLKKTITFETFLTKHIKRKFPISVFVLIAYSEIIINMKLPDNLKYTEEHEWVKIEGNVATVGITDFAQGELGELVYVEVDTVGEKIARGEVFGTVEAVKTTSDLYMPLSGKVIEFNPKLDESEGDDPTLINSDPYGDGWIIKIEVADLQELEGLMDAAAYKKVIG